MATQLPQFTQRRMMRKTSGIDRLATQFRKDVEQLTGEQQAALTQYQASVAEQMKPFEAATQQYQAQFSEYEKQAAAYKQRLGAFEAALADVRANPTITRTAYERVARGKVFGKEYGHYDVPYTYEEARPVPTFTEKAPVAPTAPTAPTIAAFDTGGFEQRREALQSGLQRELGERKAARMAAVSRRTSRPMLQGA